MVTALYYYTILLLCSKNSNKTISVLNYKASLAWTMLKLGEVTKRDKRSYVDSGDSSLRKKEKKSTTDCISEIRIDHKNRYCYEVETN